MPHNLLKFTFVFHKHIYYTDDDFFNDMEEIGYLNVPLSILDTLSASTLLLKFTFCIKRLDTLDKDTPFSIPTPLEITR